MIIVFFQVSFVFFRQCPKVMLEGCGISRILARKSCMMVLPFHWQKICIRAMEHFVHTIKINNFKCCRNSPSFRISWRKTISFYFIWDRNCLKNIFVYQSMSERRSFSRERTKSAAHFVKKERKMSAVRKSWRAQNALFFSALSFSSLPQKLS